jgi:hypothetical protein
MSLTSELNKARRKRLVEEENNLEQGNRPLYSTLDIAPTKPTEKKNEDISPVQEKRTWFQGGAFDDGYQFGDITKTILGTSEDIGRDLTAGLIGIGEKALDAGAYLVGGAAKLFGADEFADGTKEFIKKDLYDEQKVAEWLLAGTPTALINRGLKNDVEESSVLGAKTDAVIESGGQLLGTAALQAVGVPWFVTTGVTSFGAETENAFNQGAGYAAAGGSALISAGAEILTEKLSGGIKFGGKTLGDAWLQPLINKISNKVGRTIVNLGLDALGEGGEEVVSQIFSNLGSALYREEDLTEILASEEAFDEYLESFLGGAMLGGVSGGGNAANSLMANRDYKTGLTANEQKVADKEIENRIAEAEKDGKKLTGKEKLGTWNRLHMEVSLDD